jgi:hypothetical protein
MVGPVHLQKVQTPVDGLDQTDASGQKVHGANAAVSETAAALGYLIVDVAGREHGLIAFGQDALVEPSFDSALAAHQLLPYLGVHSKSLSVGGDAVLLLHQTPQKAKGFRVFSVYYPAEQERDRLVKD